MTQIILKSYLTLNNKIDEVFIGSCMTNIGHYRAAGKVLEGKTDIKTKLWIAPSN